MVIGKLKYLLRWRFDFVNAPSKFGMWNSSGPTQHGAHMAWSTNKDGLLRASIEGKDIETRKIITLAACDGHEFVNLKWYAAIKTGLKFVGNAPGVLIGMILQTREMDVLYLMDGKFAIKDRTEHDKNFNYAGFGR